MSDPLHFSDASFKQDVLESDTPVLVDFWAPWCGPCKLIGPVVEEIGDEMQDKMKVGKINVDDNPQVATQLGIRGIPTLILFKDGKPVEQIIGAVSKAHIMEKIGPHV
ncbi:thioredoxin [bacterium]|nr:thioredoxin [bacterium]MBU1651923.1 thioredoxin [bacterium]